MKKKALYVVSVCLLLGIAVFFVAQRSLSKDFSALYPNAESATSCNILHVTVESSSSKDLSSEEMDELLHILRQAKYHLDGAAGSVIEGNLYHLYFVSSQAGLTEIKLTDQGKLIVDSKQYSIDSDAACTYIQTLMA